MADTFSFLGFDGVKYTFSSFAPFDDVNWSYEHYIILADSAGKNFTFIFFSKDIICEYDKNFPYKFKTNNDKLVPSYRYSVDSSSWSFYQYLIPGSTLSIHQTYEIIGSCEHLLSYKDILITGNFSLESPKEELATYTLRPIVEEVNNRELIVKSTFLEMFSILPVLLTIFVSFIGIRKGISFLLSQINKS